MRYGILEKWLTDGRIGNSGIGYETAQQLALHNARVYIASRSQERVDQAIQKMRQTCAGRKLDLRFLKLDLKDLKSVKATAVSFAQQESRLDILINNAGVSSQQPSGSLAGTG